MLAARLGPGLRFGWRARVHGKPVGEPPGGLGIVGGLAISRTGGLPVPVWIAVIFSLERAALALAPDPPFCLRWKGSIVHFALPQTAPALPALSTGYLFP